MELKNVKKTTFDSNALQRGMFQLTSVPVFSALAFIYIYIYIYIYMSSILVLSPN